MRPLRAALSFLLRARVAVRALARRPRSPGTSRRSTTAPCAHPLLHRAEHLSFVVVGALVWTLLIDPARHGRLTVNERIGLALALFWMSQLLAYAIVFSFRPYYDVYAEQPERLFGLSPLADQKLAGVVMMVEQALTLGIALVLLLLAARRPRAAAAPRATPEPGVMPSPWSFTFEPLFVALAAVGVAALHARVAPRPGPTWRAWCFGAGRRARRRSR